MHRICHAKTLAIPAKSLTGDDNPGRPLTLVHCPTGVATQNPWLARGVDPTLKSVRLANYIRTWRKDLLKITEAAGVPHPGLIGMDDIEMMYGQMDARPMADVFGYEPGWGLPSEADQKALFEAMEATVPQGGAAPPSEHAEC